jgi:hypothetical protein
MQWTPGSLALEVKRQGRETNDFYPSSDEIENDGAVIFFRVLTTSACFQLYHYLVSILSVLLLLLLPPRARTTIWNT